MKISVVVVSWNARAFLLKCIRSILDQRGDYDLEVIVVDNASSDGSPDAVAAAFPSVAVVRNDRNYGFAKGSNIGVRRADGDYVFLINSDVEVHERCFSQMIEYMERHPRVGLSGPKIVGVDGKQQRSCMGYPSLTNSLSRALALDVLLPNSKRFGGQLMTFWKHDRTQAVQVVNGCFWVVRRSALDGVGLLDERFLIYAEDVDWCRRFNDAGWGVSFVHEASALHYGGGSSANAPIKFYLEMQRANYQYWLKHHSRKSAYVFLAIGLLHHSARLAGELIVYLVSPKARASARHKMNRALASIRWTCGAIANASPGNYSHATGESL